MHLSDTPLICLKGIHSVAGFFYITVPCLLAIIGISAFPMLIYGVLILFDVVTGVIKSYVLGKEKISSAKGNNGAIVKLMIFWLPLLFAATATSLGASTAGGYIAGGFIGVFMIFELISIVGNIASISAGEDIQEQDATTAFLRKLVKVLQVVMDSGIRGMKTLFQTDSQRGGDEDDIDLELKKTKKSKDLIDEVLDPTNKDGD